MFAAEISAKVPLPEVLCHTPFGGHLKGRANRVKVNSTGVVEGDIFHRTLVIEENARFEGTSRRNENAIETR